MVFASNTSESKAIKCTPYKVVFGRDPVLPIDVRFDMGEKKQLYDAVSAKEYSDERQVTMQEMYDTVIEQLKLSKQFMMRQYNKRLRFNDYGEGDKVWLKVKHYKTGENRKLAPRREGPWAVLQKLPNGVNFKIRNELTNETKVVHHDRLTPVREEVEDQRLQLRHLQPKSHHGLPECSTELDTDSDDSTFRGDASHSDYEPGSDDVSSADSADFEANDERRYPARDRRQREIPGAVPWSAVPRL